MRLGYVKPLLLIGDLGALYLSVIVSLIIRHLSFPSKEFIILHLLYFTPLVALWLITFYIFGLYSRAVVYFKTRSMDLLVAIHILNLFILAIPFFFFAHLPISPKLVLGIFIFTSLPILLLWRLLIFPLIFKNFKLNIRTLSINKTKLKLLNDLNNISFFTVDIKEYNIADIAKDIIRNKKIDYSIYAENSEHLALLKTLILSGRLRLFNVIDQRNLYYMLGRIPKDSWKDAVYDLLTFNRNSWALAYLFTKNVVELIIVIIVLPIIIILVAVVYLLILLIDGAPVFYKSKRRGLHGKDFILYKFRTMNGFDSGEEAKKSNLVVTSFGSLLRKIRLDELPQILNVLKGELSLVGPRPEISVLAEEYEKEIPEYILRYMVKPGLTGWAQIYHKNHPHHKIDKKLTKEKLEYDLFYIRNQGWLIDLHILAQTIMIILGFRGK